jgi:uncharacterized protein YigE (DUF2233 family)
MISSRIILVLLILVVCSIKPKNNQSVIDDPEILSYVVKAKAVKMYWKSNDGKIYGSINQLKKELENKKEKLIFAMNGGMYQKDQSPQGLYIENNKILNSLNESEGNGNFYLKPNGVFLINSDNTAYISTTDSFKYNKNIKYATQSGPMLLVNGEIHKSFNLGSKNLNIRNGVGIIDENTIIFAMSKKEINFYDFANYFKKMGCKQALYLDGYVSRTYLPEKNWIQTDGNFGVIIGVSNATK